MTLQIDVVNCRLDNRVYIRKSTEKRFALRTRDVSLQILHPNQLFWSHRLFIANNAAMLSTIRA